MRVFENISQLVTLESAHQKDGRKLVPEDLSIIENAALVFDDTQIIWLGKTEALPTQYAALPRHDLSGHTITPGIVDSHTHIVFGGNRAREYAARLNGADYEAIAKMGGGILFTMKHTKESSRKDLFDASVEKIERFHQLGINTIEIKSGYALTYDKELELSQIIYDLKEHFRGRVKIFNTYLAAHAVPKEYKTSAAFMNEVVLPLLENLAPQKIIDAVDIFQEEGYFSADDVQRLFIRSKELGIATKIHADEFNDNNGAGMAVDFSSLSADHLMKCSDENIHKLSNSSTVATLLPGTSLFLGKPLAPARKFLDAGCKVALASDYNPGSCHIDNLLLIASMAGPLYKLNQAELWGGITLNAAHALGFYKDGCIKEGFSSNVSIFKANTIDEITYAWGQNLAVPMENILAEEKP